MEIAATLIHLFTWFWPDGSSQYITPEPPKKRTVDSRPGDWLTHSGGRFQVKAVRAYREHLVRADELGLDLQAKEGFVVKARR